MPKHLPFEQNKSRKKCPLEGAHGPHESVVVQHHADPTKAQEIPRICLEYLGIDIGDLNNRAYFFNREQSEKISKHVHTLQVT